MTWGEEYPIGYLDDVAINFMHYDTCQEAEEEWEKRKTRIIRDNIIVLCTDMVDFTNEVYENGDRFLILRSCLLQSVNMRMSLIQFFSQNTRVTAKFLI